MVLFRCSHSLTNSKSLSSSLLLGESDGGLVSLGNGTGSLVNVELDVTVGGKVGGNSTVGSVSSSAALNSALDNDVVDDALVDVESLGLGVGDEVQEEFTDVGDRLLGPSTLRLTIDLGLGVSTTSTIVLSERNNLFVFKHVVHVLNGSLKLHALDSFSSLISVLEMSSKIGDLGLSGYTETKV